MNTMLRIAGPVFLLLAAGCAGVEERTPLGEPVAAKPPQADAAKKEAVVAKPEARPAPPPVAEPPVPGVAKVNAPVASASPKVPGPAAPAEPARKKEAAVPPVAKPAPPPAAKPLAPLDLTALEKRLKDTNAIGVFTKLTLKNQVDELLDRFRAYYEGRVKTTLVQLRQPYDLLILKVLSLLQDNDPSLARAVAESREAIWGILSDPNKFKSL